MQNYELIFSKKLHKNHKHSSIINNLPPENLQSKTPKT